MTDKLTYAEAIKIVEDCKRYYNESFSFIGKGYTSEECKKIDKLLKDNGLTGISRFSGFTARWLCDYVIKEIIKHQENANDR